MRDRINFNIRCQDRDNEDEEERGAAPTPPLHRALLSRTAARKMLTSQLADELASRNASTEGGKEARLQRLLYILDKEVEAGYTKGDVDECRGVHPINLQVDNATPHVGNDNITRLNQLSASQEDGFTISVTLQPPNSPELNLNDMSVLRSLASQASKLANVRSDCYENIVCNVVRAFDDYPADAIYRAYAETFAVYREILKHCGGNDFKMPHGDIRKNESHGLEIVDYYVEVAVVDRARKWLVDHPLPNPDL